jgi:hypothetical protein
MLSETSERKKFFSSFSSVGSMNSLIHSAPLISDAESMASAEASTSSVPLMG